jgi:hypothetical protein
MLASNLANHQTYFTEATVDFDFKHSTVDFKG